MQQDPSSESQKSGSFFRRLFKLQALAVALLTLLAGWCSVFKPGAFWYIAILGMGFPFLFAINLINVSVLLMRGSRGAVMPVIAAVATVTKMSLLFQPGLFNSSDPNPQQGFEVMSYNVRLFDLYNWSHNHETRNRILSFLNQNRPDILCLQEFYSSDHKNFDNVSALKKMLGPGTLHVEFPITLYGTDHYGIATFTRLPVAGKGVLYFDRKTANICIFTDVVYQEDTIRVFNCHLQSVRFGEKDYQFLKEIQSLDDKAGPDRYQRTRNIFKRLQNGYVKRQGQADLLADQIRNSPYPVVVCGDFNDTPLSYVYETIADNLNDAFRESGSGWGSTYAGPIPGLRIDYILHDPEIRSTGFSRHSETLSDHFAISARLFPGPVKKG